MVVPYGKSVGIMGPSGAGKSTIVDILLGLLTIHQGRILCDGVDVFDNYPAWLAQIGYIPQSIYLVDEPVRNNIAFGIADDEIDDARIWDALEEAQLAEFIRGLPEGLDTAIGDRGAGSPADRDSVLALRGRCTTILRSWCLTRRLRRSTMRRRRPSWRRSTASMAERR